MSRDLTIQPTALAARNRLERARASCQELLEELGFQHPEEVRAFTHDDHGVVA
jgi:hypothetical protein